MTDIYQWYWLLEQSVDEGIQQTTTPSSIHHKVRMTVHYVVLQCAQIMYNAYKKYLSAEFVESMQHLLPQPKFGSLVLECLMISLHKWIFSWKVIWYKPPFAPSFQLCAPLHVDTPLSSVHSLALESLSSFSSTSIHFSPLVGSLLSNCSDYDHLPSREELDQTHIQLVSADYKHLRDMMWDMMCAFPLIDIPQWIYWLSNWWRFTSSG